MKIFVFLVLAASSLIGLNAQTCPAGQALNAPVAAPSNYGPCVQVSMSAGTYIQQLGLTGAMATQTICSTTTDQTDPQYCAAGFYRIEIQIRPATAGTLSSSVNAVLNFTDDVGALSPTVIANLSLVTLTPGQIVYAFYKTAGTSVSVNTTVGTLTGSPSYNFRARLFRAPGS